MFNGVSVQDAHEVLEMDSGDGHTALSMYLTPLTHTLKRVKMMNCMLCVIYHRK